MDDNIISLKWALKSFVWSYRIENHIQILYTVKVLNIQTQEKIAVITLTFEQHGFIIEYCKAI